MLKADGVPAEIGKYDGGSSSRLRRIGYLVNHSPIPNRTDRGSDSISYASSDKSPHKTSAYSKIVIRSLDKRNYATDTESPQSTGLGMAAAIKKHPLNLRSRNVANTSVLFEKKSLAIG